MLRQSPADSLEVLRVGYTLGSRVLRAAQVVVAKAGEPWPEATESLSVETEDPDDGADGPDDDTEDARPASLADGDGAGPNDGEG